MIVAVFSVVVVVVVVVVIVVFVFVIVVDMAQTIDKASGEADRV